jgi:polyhydroxyalkanoate synthesis regulator phasin
MTEKDKQLADLNNDVKNLLIDKKDLDSLSSMVTNLRKKIDNLENNTISEEE